MSTPISNNARTVLPLLLGAAVIAAAFGAPPPASAAPTATGPTRIASDVTPAAARHFTATGDLGRYYTKQTVTGTYRNRHGRPVKVSVYDWQGTELVFTAKPRLDKSWWGNYWHDTYGLDQWSVGSGGGMTFHFMLPPPPMGSSFTALLVTEFDVGGNWQNWMDGTAVRPW
jgi:hypothetical protein